MNSSATNNVTVIIAAYQKPKALSFVLLALKRQTILPEEVIVADDGSGPEMRDMLSNISSSLPFRLSHVWQKNEGFRAARSRNNAIYRSTGKIIAFLDQDVLPHRNWLEQHLHHTRPGQVSIGRMLELSGDISQIEPQQIENGEFETWHKPDQMTHMNKLQKKNAFYAAIRRAGIGIKAKPALQTCNTSAHRDDLFRVNGLDEEYIGWGQEDDDLGRRLYKAGVTPCPVINKALVSHMPHPVCHTEWKNGSNIERFHRKLSSFRSARGLADHPHSDVIFTEFNG